jgi:hypothetical protein
MLARDWVLKNFIIYPAAGVDASKGEWGPSFRSKKFTHSLIASFTHFTNNDDWWLFFPHKSPIAFLIAVAHDREF